MFRLVKAKPKRPVTIREHHERRNRILVRRRAGGFGDVLMQRMIFEDMSRCFEGAEITWSLPDEYIHFGRNHPFCRTVRLAESDERSHGAVYDITTACRVHESRWGWQNDKNRSDIWAAHCGVTLVNHRMHLGDGDQDALAHFRKELASMSGGRPTVLLSPFAAGGEAVHADGFGVAKSLEHDKIKDLAKRLGSMGYWVFATHDSCIEALTECGVPQFAGVGLDTWEYLVRAADYVISVDTATFHLAGGLGKPLVGIFSFTDGKLYGKHYDFVLVQRHRDNGDWDCGPCFLLDNCPKSREPKKPCMTELTVDEIMDGFAKATMKWPCGPGRGVLCQPLPVIRLR